MSSSSSRQQPHQHLLNSITKEREQFRQQQKTNGREHHNQHHKSDSQDTQKRVLTEEDARGSSKNDEVEPAEQLSAVPALQHKVEFIANLLNTSVKINQVDSKTCEDLRQSLGISLKGKHDDDEISTFAPVTSWSDPRLPYDLFERYHEANQSKLNKPTPIQSQLWPCMLSGRDVLAMAPTGSGKTLGFSLPLAAHVMRNAKPGFVCALIIAPTRELAVQIGKVVAKFSGLFGVQSLTIYGGGGGSDNRTNAQDFSKEAPPAIIVATPGRLLDLVSSNDLSIDRVTSVVLDEADRMLQLGLREQLEKILSHTPHNRQLVLASATWANDSLRLATSTWLKLDHFQIYVNALAGGQQMNLGVVSKLKSNGGELDENREIIAGDTEGDLMEYGGSITLAKEIIQTIHVCAEHKKPRKLIRYIERIRKQEADEGKTRNPGPMVVFCNKIKTVLFVYEFLAKQNIRVVAIHGSMQQDRRERALQEFRAGKYTCLVATDVAGRGLHIPNLIHVVNYDFPASLTQYAHRVGRCGRGKSGTALSFFTRNLLKMAPDLIKLLEASHQYVDPNLRQLVHSLDVDEEVEPNQSDAGVESGEELRKAESEESADEDELEEKDDKMEAIGRKEKKRTAVDHDAVELVVEENAGKVGEGSDGSDNDSLDEFGGIFAASDADEDDVDGAHELSAFDFVGSVPLTRFDPTSKPKQAKEKQKTTAKTFKRPRGVRGGKKSRSKKARMASSVKVA